MIKLTKDDCIQALYGGLLLGGGGGGSMKMGLDAVQAIMWQAPTSPDLRRWLRPCLDRGLCRIY